MKRYARSFAEHFWGLMFDNDPNAEMEFIFDKPTRDGASIHTLFMRYPIEVEWLDENRQVIERAKIKPWTLNYTPRNPAKYIIERRIQNV